MKDRWSGRVADKAAGVAVLTGLLACALGSTVPGQTRLVSLYEARAIVGGRGEANRAAGFALCLQDVLVKLSGDPRLIKDPRALELGAHAGTLFRTFATATAWRASRAMTSRAPTIGRTT